MATVKVRTQGNTALEGLELENFSTEETLQAILTQLKDMGETFGIGSKPKDNSQNKKSNVEKKFDDFVSKTTPNAQAAASLANIFNNGKATNSLSGIISLFESLNPELLMVVGTVKLFEVAVDGIENAVNLVSKTLSSVMNTFGLMIGTFISGSTTLSSYFYALKQGTANIPIIGTFTSLIYDGVNNLEQWNNTLLDISKVGANFGGDIAAMMTGAADAGMSLEAFANIIQSNATKFATFGSVMEGVNTYTKVTRIVMRDYADQLSKMGISFQQYAEEAPAILSLFGASMKARGATERDLAQATVDLIGNFNSMSELTGKTRDQQAAELEKQITDPAWAQLTLSRGEGEKQIAIMNQLTQTLGPAYGELYKLTVLGMPPLTQELQTLTATVPGLSQSFSEMEKVAKSNLTGLAAQKQMNKITADIAAQAISSTHDFKTAIAAASAGLGGTPAEISRINTELYAKSREFIDANGQLNKAVFQQNLDRIAEDQYRNKKTSENFQVFNNLMLTFRDKLWSGVVAPLINNLAPVIGDIVDQLEKNQGPLVSIVTFASDLANQFGAWITKARENGDLDKYLNEFSNFVIGAIKIAIDVSKAIVSIVSFVVDNWGFIKIALGGIVVAMTALTAIVGTAGLLFVVPKLISSIASLTDTFPILKKAIASLSTSILDSSGGLVSGIKSLIGKGAAAEVGGAVATEATGAVAGSAIGLEGATIGATAGGLGIGGVLAGESAAGPIGWALAVATLLGYGGYKAVKSGMLDKILNGGYNDNEEPSLPSNPRNNPNSMRNQNMDMHADQFKRMHKTLEEINDKLGKVQRNTLTSAQNS